MIFHDTRFDFHDCSVDDHPRIEMGDQSLPPVNKDRFSWTRTAVERTGEKGTDGGRSTGVVAELNSLLFGIGLQVCPFSVCEAYRAEMYDALKARISSSKMVADPFAALVGALARCPVCLDFSR